MAQLKHMLIDNVTVGSATHVPFHIPGLWGGQATVSAIGLAGAEVVTIQKHVGLGSVYDALDAEFVDVVKDGTAQGVTVDNNPQVVDGPGAFRVSVASSAGPISVLVEW